MLELSQQIRIIRTICFVILSLNIGIVKSQILVQEVVTGKNKEIDFGTKIFYKLFSDSTLGVEITPDYGVITTSYDSILVFANGIEISAKDISYIEIDRKRLKKWRNFSKPFLILGMGILSKGVLMALGEGTESKNGTLVPIYLYVGSSLSGFSSIPFLKKNKSFDLTEGNFKIITP
jgi:hypothetical protein